MHGIKEKVFVIAAYLPPNLALLRARACLEYISDCIAEAKRVYEDCLIIVAGDFNQWPAEEMVEAHPEFKEVVHGPTRGNRSIDRTFCNFSRSVTESSTLNPLEDEFGRKSDHRIAFMSAKFTSEPDKTVRYSYRFMSDEGTRGFLDWVARASWDSVYTAESTTDKAMALQTQLDGAMDEFFPIKTTVRREKDPPWINHQIRTLIKKRRKIYDREGRSTRWKGMKKKGKKMMKKRVRKYWANQRKALLAPDAARVFYKNVRSYQYKEKAPDFNVRDLFEGKDDGEVTEELAVHFNRISSESDGLTKPIPDAPYQALPFLSRADIERRLVSFKNQKAV